MTATQESMRTTGDKLLGRVAFVTGGTRGIGAGICRSLVRQGADVAGGDRRNERGGRRAEGGGGAAASPPPRGAPRAEEASPPCPPPWGVWGAPDDCRRTVA